MKKLYLFLFTLIVGMVNPCAGQNKWDDSLYKIYTNTKQADTIRLNAIYSIANAYVNENKPDTAIVLAKQQLELALRTKQTKYEGKSFYLLGDAYSYKKNEVEALKYSSKALALFEQINDKKEKALTLWNIGNIYLRRSNYPKGLEYYLKSLKISEEINDKKVMGMCLNNISFIYGYQKNFQKELEYLLYSLKLWEEVGSKFWIGIVNENIGSVYQDISNYPKAMEYYLIALKKFEQTNDISSIGTCYNDIGSIYRDQADYTKALDYFVKALALLRNSDDKENAGICYANIGNIYILLKEYKTAIKYIDSSLQQSKYIENERLGYQYLSTAYSKIGKYKEAYENHVKFKNLTDSIYNGEDAKKINDLQNNFEAEKREAEQAKLDAITLEQKKQQQFVIYAVVSVLFIVILFSGLLYKRFRLTNKQKQIIEIKSKEAEEQKQEVIKQKHVIVEKQQEIIDSITYAKRLQQAILPSIESVKEQLPNSFVYYQPKDIVAGDFYWMHSMGSENRDMSRERSTVSNLSSQYANLTFIAAADCTGHGVPGAMVSVVCSNALNRAVNEFNLSDTGLILDKTRELVIETFEKSDSEVKDGMDISLLRIEKDTNQTKIQWSGANNSLWYILNNELTEVKADKQPIGKYSEPTPFTTNNVIFNESVSLYLFSDGYADQFSENDKKLMKKKFRDIILSIQDLSMFEQKDKIEKIHVDWKGTMEQTDDVLVIGIKI